MGPRLPKRWERGGTARHEKDEVGSPFIGREEDGVERYHFVHRDEMVIRLCTRIRRMEGGAGKAGEEGVKLRGVRLRVGRGRLTEKLGAENDGHRRWEGTCSYTRGHWGKVRRGRARLNSPFSERM